MLKANRLQHQQIEHTQFDNPVDVLSHLGAIQGQDYSGAKWSLSLRLIDCTNVQIEEAMANKQIVRTWLMRGTLFLTTAKDLHWMLDIVAPREIARSKRRYKELELDAKTLSRSNDILVKALADGKQIRRRQLYAVLEENGISTKGQRGVHIIRHASLEGLIVQGIMHKNDPVLMSLDSLAKTKSLSTDESMAELAYRYFSSRGFATLQDFAWWTGLLMADVRAGFEAIRPNLIEEVIDGESYYHTNNITIISSPESPCVYTLPGFDEYYLGYKDRYAVIEPKHELKVCPGKNGVFFPTIVIDGQICGIWKHTFKKHVIEVLATPFTPLTDCEKEAFSTSIQHFGEFLEMPLHVSFEN